MKIINGCCFDDYDGLKHETVNGKCKPLPFYARWKNMIDRCYSARHKKNMSYRGCEVCDDWKSLSKFKEWFDVNYVEGWQLDKDILVDGNKTYSPAVCRFMPVEINQLLTSGSKRKHDLPLGVSFHKRSGLYVAQMKQYNKNKTIGYSRDPIIVHEAYKTEKYRHSIEVIESFRGEVSDEILNAAIERAKEICL